VEGENVRGLIMAATGMIVIEEVAISVVIGTIEIVGVAISDVIGMIAIEAAVILVVTGMSAVVIETTVVTGMIAIESVARGITDEIERTTGIVVGIGIWTEDHAMMFPRKIGMEGEEIDPGIVKPSHCSALNAYTS